jgi:hypothetical protein
MVNPFKDVNWKPGTAERRKFAVSLLIGFPCLALALLLIGWVKKGAWNANVTPALYLAGGGVLVGGFFWLLPSLARPFYVAWYFLACCIGIVMSNLMLMGFYYLVLTPFGLCKRLVHPSIAKKFDRQTATYWRDAPPQSDPARYFKQF